MRSCLWFCVLTAVLPAQQTQPPSRVDLWKQDITATVQALRQNHPAPAVNISPAELDQAASELGEKVAQLPDYGVVMELAKLTARIGDPSTFLTPFQSVVGMRAFPIRIRRFDTNWYVTDAIARHAPLLGRRLTSIQGVPIDVVVDQIKPYIPHETENWLAVMAGTFLICPEVLAHIGLLPDRNSAAEYEFEDGSGTRQPVSMAVDTGTLFPLARTARGTVPLAWRNRGLFYWFDYLEAEKTLYIKYDVCAQDPTLAVRDFVRDLTQFAESRPVVKLVLDLRDNTGGDPTVTELLLLSLEQAQSAGTLPRRAFGIISRATFASGALAALQWKKMGATLVGETAGGRPHHFGALRLLALPATRLVLQVATREVAADEGDLVPDIAAGVTVSDVRILRDTMLEAILAAP